MSTKRKHSEHTKDIESIAPEVVQDREATPSKKQRKGSLDGVDIRALLDFSSDELSSSAAITARFDCIATQLLHHHLLVCQSTTGDNLSSAALSTVQTEEYNILEVEFYLLKGDCHKDPYTHGNEEQRVSGQWYFHRAPRRLGIPSPAPSDGLPILSGYRGGTRKGLDLTLGTSPSLLSSNAPLTSRFFGSTDTMPSTSTIESNVRGGVLLRSILRKSDKRVISGPSLLVDELLRVSGATSIVELVKDKWSGDISAFPIAPSTAFLARLFLRPIAKQGNPSTDSPRIYRSPRIGLDLSNSAVQLSTSDPRIIYVAKPYRYFVHPHLLITNGRGQTFFAIYKSCLENSSTKAAGDKDKLIDEVSRLTGLKTQSVIKYSRDYESGRSSGNIKSFIGPVGKGASASPTTFVRMMGSLERFLARPN